MKNRHFRALVWFSLEEKLVLKKSTDIFRDSGRVSVREHKILNSIDRSGTEGGTRERGKKGPTEGGSGAERLSPDGHGGCHLDQPGCNALFLRTGRTMTCRRANCPGDSRKRERSCWLRRMGCERAGSLPAGKHGGVGGGESLRASAARGVAPPAESALPSRVGSAAAAVTL